MKEKMGKPFLKHHGIHILVICFWLLLWEILSLVIHQEIFMASPVAVLITLVKLVQTISFWQTILFSFLRIVVGFVMALLVGTVLAVFSFQSWIVRELLTPFMMVIKSTPVASFIILALIWIRPWNLSILISFLMVVPMIYTCVGQGLKAADEKLLQMAKVFGFSRLKRVKAIYLPSVLPYFISAVSVGLGFCWKAGIAAEVIGIPSGTIGARLYEAKLYLMTKELFAWTIVIIIISILFEKAVMFLIQLLQQDSADK